MELEFSLADTLVKVAIFVLVQVLVYLILKNSSDVFSKNEKLKSLSSFKPARSVSIRRMLAAISDLPQGAEPSPSSRGPRSPTQESSILEDNKED